MDMGALLAHGGIPFDLGVTVHDRDGLIYATERIVEGNPRLLISLSLLEVYRTIQGSKDGNLNTRPTTESNLSPMLLHPTAFLP